jgi:hypothetical protein
MLIIVSPPFVFTFISLLAPLLLDPDLYALPDLVEGAILLVFSGSSLMYYARALSLRLSLIAISLIFSCLLIIILVAVTLFFGISS